MSQDKAQIADSLHRLGQQIRKNWAKKNAMPEQHMEQIRETIRAQCLEEQRQIDGSQPAEEIRPDIDHDHQPEGHKPPEPDLEP